MWTELYRQIDAPYRAAALASFSKKESILLAVSGYHSSLLTSIGASKGPTISETGTLNAKWGSEFLRWLKEASYAWPHFLAH
jgi:hypothetical protein